MIIIWCHVWYGFVNNGSSYKMSIGLCVLLIWITVCYSLEGGGISSRNNFQCVDNFYIL